MAYFNLNISGEEVQRRLDLAMNNALYFDGIVDTVSPTVDETRLTSASSYTIVALTQFTDDDEYYGIFAMFYNGVYYINWSLTDGDGTTITDSTWFNDGYHIRGNRMFINKDDNKVYVYNDNQLVASVSDGQPGNDGAQGADGITPHIDETTGNWFIGDDDTGVHAQGAQGEAGASAFDIWKAEHGTESSTVNEYLAWLKDQSDFIGPLYAADDTAVTQEGVLYYVPDSVGTTFSVKILDEGTVRPLAEGCPGNISTDSTPTEGSGNLVDSNGIYESLYGELNYVPNKKLSNRQIVDSTNTFISVKVPVTTGYIRWIYGAAQPSETLYLFLYDENDNYLDWFGSNNGSNGARNCNISNANAAYVIATFMNDGEYTAMIMKGTTVLWEKKSTRGVFPTLKDYIDENLPDIVIDDDPTEGSVNLVKSGGVFDGIKDLDLVVNGQQTNFELGTIYTSGSLGTSTTNIRNIDLIPCEAGDVVDWYCGTSSSTFCLNFYDENESRLALLSSDSSGHRQTTAPTSARYIRAAFCPSSVDNPTGVYININGSLAWKPLVYIEGHEERITNLESDTANLGLIIGKDDAIHITKDGVFAEDSLGIGIDHDATSGACYETQPRISVYDRALNVSSSVPGTVAKTGACATEVYKLRATEGNLVYYCPNPDSVSDSSLLFYMDGTYVNYRTVGFDDSIHTIAIISNTNEFAITLTTAGLDDSYCYESKTGYIHFAGRNTQYYGHKFISDIVEEDIDYGAIGDAYPEQAKFIKDNLTEGFTNRFAFCHISDVHGGFPTNIGEFVEKSEVKFLAMTGDNVVDKYGDAFAASSINAMDKPCFITTGNHDVLHAEAISDVYNAEFATIKDHLVELSNDGSEYSISDSLKTGGKTYYSVVYEVGKQGGDLQDTTGNNDTGGNGYKCIFLDCYEGLSSFENGDVASGSLSSEQIGWFHDELQDAITNKYNVIVFLHNRPSACGLMADRWSDAFVMNEKTYSYGLGCIPIIIDAFKNGTTANFEHGGQTYSLAFSGKGNFVAYFSGHTHYDVVGHLTEYPDQLNVTIGKINGLNDGGHDVTRRANGLNVTFNYVVIDKKTGTISIYRVGCQETICGYKRDLFVDKWR